MVGYEVGTKAYRLWDPKRRTIVKSRDVIFDERLKPPAVSAPPVDLSEILWDGELEHEGLTRVGDNWDTTSHGDEIPSQASTPDASEPELDQIENDNFNPPMDPEPPAPIEEPVPAPVRRARRTELEMLGPPPEIDGPRLRCLPTRYVQLPDLPDPQPDLPDPDPIGEGANPEDLEDPELAAIAFAFAASVGSTSSSDPLTY
jgi:hypothetical protein